MQLLAQIDQLEEQLTSASKFETFALLKTNTEIVIAELTWRKSTNSVVVKLSSEFAPDQEEESANIELAFSSLSNLVPGAAAYLDTLIVAITDEKGHRFLNSTHDTMRVTKALWSNYFTESAAKPYASEHVDTIRQFEKEIQLVDKVNISLWVKHRDYFKEIEITSNKNGNFLYVHRRNSINTYEGLSYRVSDVECAFAVLSRLGEDAKSLIHTLLVFTNRTLLGFDATELASPDTQISLNTRSFLDVAIPIVEDSSDDLVKDIIKYWKNDSKSFTAKISLHNSQVRSLQIQEMLLPLLSSGKTGVQQWNDTPETIRELSRFDEFKFENQELNGLKFGKGSFRKAVFDRCKLRKSSCKDADFSQASFIGADLFDSRLQGMDATGADFSKADLRKVKFSKACLRNANLKEANVEGADFSRCDVHGVDLTALNAAQAHSFTRAKYDESTKIPSEFPFWKDLEWDGEGPDPFKVHKLSQISSKPAIDFSEFLELINSGFDKGRISKALDMLKADRFQLFSQQTEAGVIGVIKSQTNPELIYACKLGSEGTFCCCTQNLNPCGGLRGALCKHILVLIIALTKTSELDASDAAKYVLASTSETPKLDKDRMIAVFLKYKGAQCGELDWRPTETIPEDYYSLG